MVAREGRVIKEQVGTFLVDFFECTLLAQFFKFFHSFEIEKGLFHRFLTGCEPVLLLLISLRCTSPVPIKTYGKNVVDFFSKEIKLVALLSKLTKASKLECRNGFVTLCRYKGCDYGGTLPDEYRGHSWSKGEAILALSFLFSRSLLMRSLWANAKVINRMITFSWIWHGMILAFGRVVLVGGWLGLTS